MLDSMVAYLQRLIAAGLQWELKRTEKGLGLHVKDDCTLALQTLTELLGRAEMVELTDEQWERQSADPEQQCLVQSCGKMGVMIGPVALLNKPCSGSAPHVVLCSLPTVRVLDRLKERKGAVLQNVAEQQQQSGAEGRQCLQKQQQQQQHMHATRSSGEQPLSFEEVSAAKARTRAVPSNRC